MYFDFTNRPSKITTRKVLF